jgi:hypothetical protein
VVTILLIGLASAATAVTVHPLSAAHETTYSVGANSFGGPGRMGLAEVLY